MSHVPLIFFLSDEARPSRKIYVIWMGQISPLTESSYPWQYLPCPRASSNKTMRYEWVTSLSFLVIWMSHISLHSPSSHRWQYLPCPRAHSNKCVPYPFPTHRRAVLQSIWHKYTFILNFWHINLFPMFLGSLLIVSAPYRRREVLQSIWNKHMLALKSRHINMFLFQ